MNFLFCYYFLLFFINSLIIFPLILDGWTKHASNAWPYLSERVLRQFGHVKHIPRYPQQRLM